MGGVFVRKWNRFFFVKKVDLSPTKWNETDAGLIFYFTFYLFGGLHTHPMHPPAYRPGSLLCNSVRGIIWAFTLEGCSLYKDIVGWLAYWWQLLVVAINCILLNNLCTVLCLLCKCHISVITSPAVGRRSIVMMCLSVFVCPQTYLWNYTSDLHHFLHVTYDRKP